MQLSRTGRATEGYGALMDWLARDLGSRLRLGHEVRSISWRRGRVTVETARRSQKISARAAIVTVPVSVLAALPPERGSITIDPVPPSLTEALDGIAMGSAMRLVAWFESVPWHSKEHENCTFLQFSSGPFQAAWTGNPYRFPLVTLWCGGPEARVLSRLTEAELKRTFVSELATSLGTTTRRLVRSMRGFWWHDWDRDPHSRGSYSYVTVGGRKAAEALRRPAQATLFFAGEATEKESGTVEAALVSGARAAESADRALSRKRRR